MPIQSMLQGGVHIRDAKEKVSGDLRGSAYKIAIAPRCVFEDDPGMSPPRSFEQCYIRCNRWDTLAGDAAAYIL